MGRSDEGAYELPPESRPGLLHRGVIGGGSISSPGLDPEAEAEAAPGPSNGFTRRILGALVLFAVVVVTLVTLGRDGRRAVVDSADAAKTTGALAP